MWTGVMRMRLAPLWLALVFLSCAPSAPSVSRSASPPATSTSKPVSLIGSPAMLVPTTTAVADWRDIEGVALCGRYLAWHGNRTGNPQRDPQQLMVLDRASGRSIVLATAPQPAGLMAWLRISDSWAVWAEYTDRVQITDWRLRAARLPDGVPFTLLEAPPNARLDDRPEFELQGDELMLATRRSAGGHELLRMNLMTRETRVMMQTTAPETLAWPAFDGSSVFVESHVSAGSRLLAMDRDGKPQTVPAPPASEPSLSQGWLAYKSSERSELGTITFRFLATGETLRTPDKGEAPAARDGNFAWISDSAPRLRAYDAVTRRAFAWDAPRDLAIASPALAGRNVAVITQRLEPPGGFAVVMLELP